MQLNKTHRVAIIAGLVKATYKDRFQTMIQRTNDFAALVWEHEFGELERTLRKKLTKEQQRQCFATSPRFEVKRSDPRDDSSDYYHSNSLVTPHIQGPDVHKDKVFTECILVGEKPNGRHRDSHQFKAEGKLVTHEQQIRSIVHILPDHPLRADLEALMADHVALVDEAESFGCNLRSVLAGITTDTKLLELLPEAEPYIPRPPKRQDVVPMSTIEAVRQRINNTSPKAN